MVRLRAWFNGRTGSCQDSDVGPIPIARSKGKFFLKILK